MLRHILKIQNKSNEGFQTFKIGAHEYLTKKSVSNGFFGRPVLSAIERAQLTAQLENFRNRLEVSNQALTEFTHMAAHDLKSPLRRINSYCEILLEDAAERLNDEDKQTVERMMVNAKRMNRCIIPSFFYGCGKV